jgi:hypothetical protein
MRLPHSHFLHTIPISSHLSSSLFPNPFPIPMSSHSFIPNDSNAWAQSILFNLLPAHLHFPTNSHPSLTFTDQTLTPSHLPLSSNSCIVYTMHHSSPLSCGLCTYPPPPLNIQCRFSLPPPPPHPQLETYNAGSLDPQHMHLI